MVKPDPMVDAILNGWSFVALFAWVWFLFMAAALPVWMLGSLFYLAKIARQLRRLNDAPPSAPLVAPPAPQRGEAAGFAPSLGHQLLR